jgi:hypothetical protein
LHRFALRAISAATLEIDGRQVLDVNLPDQQEEEALALSQGDHAIRLRFRDQDGYSHVYLSWAPPGEDSLLPVPPGVLRPW